MRIFTALALAASFEARFPKSNVVDRIEAEEEGSVETIQAMAIRSFTPGSQKLQFVKATSHFYVNGEFVAQGDFVEVEEAEAKRLVRNHQAILATDADLAAAQKATK